MPNFTAQEVEDFSQHVLQAVGLTPDAASTTAKCLVMANLRGLESHGVLRLMQYAETIVRGEVNPNHRFESSAAKAAPLW